MKKEWTTREKILLGISVAAVVVGGVALYNTRETNKLLTNGLSKIKDGIDVDIPDALVEKAMKEAVKEEAKREAKNAASRVANHVEKDISEQVAALLSPVRKELREMAVESYVELIDEDKSTILKEIRNDVVEAIIDDIDISELSEEVTSKAKKKLINKLVKEMAS